VWGWFLPDSLEARIIEEAAVIVAHLPLHLGQGVGPGITLAISARLGARPLSNVIYRNKILGFVCAAKNLSAHVSWLRISAARNHGRGKGPNTGNLKSLWLDYYGDVSELAKEDTVKPLESTN
jgi:hypothetical protein